MVDSFERRTSEKIREEHSWAIEIVRKHFSVGLGRICAPKFLTRRYQEFEIRNDPIYAELLRGMEDEALAKTFVSYWTIAHTLATQSRFWLENAVAEIIIHQVRRFGREATHVYSQWMLGEGYLKRQVTVADLGEQALEHLSGRKPWRPEIQTAALQAIDVLVGEQERERPPERKPFQVRQWDREKDKAVQSRDHAHLKKVAEALSGPPASEVPLQCNLLVVEPDKLDGKMHAWGLRFINPKTLSSHPARKQERVNMLRLYALLVQEKIMREAKSIHVGVAELIPRDESGFARDDHYPDYFSSVTYWSSDRLWAFIGVPFEVVSLAIQDVAKEFRNRLIEGLRDLLPKIRKR